MGGKLKILVGLFLLGALVIFALGTFYIEDWGLLLKEGYALEAQFERADNLEQGDPVTMAGVKIGEVKSLRVETERGGKYPVIVTLWVQGDVVVRAEDVPMIRTESIFGGKYIPINRGPATAKKLEPGEMLKPGEVMPDIPEVIAQMKTSLGKTEQAIENITEITQNLKEGKGTIGKLLMEEKAYDELMAAARDAKGAFQNIRELSQEIKDGKGLAATIIKDEELATDFKAMTKDISQLTKDAKEIADDAKAFMKDLREIGDKIKKGEGTIGKLVQSDELYTDVKSLVEEARKGMKPLSEAAQKIAEGKGTIGKLVNSEEAYDSLMASLKNVREFTQDLKDAEGTLPKLMKDDTLYVQLTRAVKGIQEAIDDYREQSPIVTFTGVVFGAF